MMWVALVASLMIKKYMKRKGANYDIRFQRYVGLTYHAAGSLMKSTAQKRASSKLLAFLKETNQKYIMKNMFKHFYKSALITKGYFKQCIRNKREQISVLTKILNRERNRLFSELAIKKGVTPYQKKLGGVLQTLSAESIDKAAESYFDVCKRAYVTKFNEWSKAVRALEKDGMIDENNGWRYRAIYPKAVWSFKEVGYKCKIKERISKMIQFVSPLVVKAHGHHLKAAILK